MKMRLVDLMEGGRDWHFSSAQVLQLLRRSYRVPENPVLSQQMKL
jgi:hypothetical protein